MRGIAVYTCNFGDYDPLRDPIVVDPVADYIYFTDRPRESSAWDVQVVPLVHTPIMQSRDYFCCSTLHLPDYPITVEHGADCCLKVTASRLAAMLPPEYDIGVFPHPYRQNVYEEGDACIRFKKDTAERIKPQMERYRREGLPESVRLSTCILTIRRNTAQVEELEEMWWGEVCDGSHRNQLSFDYCRWKLGVEVFHLPGSPYDHSLMEVYRH